jgi:hypothetical protein
MYTCFHLELNIAVGTLIASLEVTPNHLDPEAGYSD